ncbi:hypothetical protein GCM10023200_21010 [Actinomycetospora chlora]|uniref:DUF4383 domain-containing protein n=1 Tax=Actinomycetospora chlora TaxID=663608 RepID=A0ABP9AV63_9PSEU
MTAVRPPTSTPVARGAPAPLSRRVVLVHRIGALLVAAVIAVFGILGFAGGLTAFETRGVPLLGLSTNGLLSTVSVVTAAVLVLTAIRGGRPASTAMIVIGAAFLVAAFAGLAVLSTPANLLAFRLPNVFFSIAAGLVLLVVGSYGRVGAHLPDDNPYVAGGDPLARGALARLASESTQAAQPEDHQPRPRTAAEARADRELAAAFRARALGESDADTDRWLTELEALPRHEQRRVAWMTGRAGR